MTDTTDPRPCRGQNSNICVAEGCFGEACVKLAAAQSTEPTTDVRAALYREVAEDVARLPLGYRPQDVAAALRESADRLGDSSDVERIVREVALRQLGPYPLEAHEEAALQALAKGVAAALRGGR